VASKYLTRAVAEPAAQSTSGSPYRSRFAAGATVFPRFLFMVEAAPTSKLGAGAGRQRVRSQRTASEKRPWRDLPPVSSTVEAMFLRSLYLGETVLPYRLQEPKLAVIPLDGTTLLGGDKEQIRYHPGLAAWWQQADVLWEENKKSDLTLIERLDFRHGLRDQFPAPVNRVVYTASGMYLAAARVNDPRAVIEHKLYWAPVSGIDEARYLTAILNSDVLTQLVRPLQGRGEHNPRDFDKYIFQLPIPLYDQTSPEHQQLVNLAERAEDVAQAVELPSDLAFQALRRRIRAALIDDGVGRIINDLTEAVIRPRTGD
jgi:hypothetical protein